MLVSHHLSVIKKNCENPLSHADIKLNCAHAIQDSQEKDCQIAHLKPHYNNQEPYFRVSFYVLVFKFSSLSPSYRDSSDRENVRSPLDSTGSL